MALISYDNMKGNTVKNVGKPKQPKDALTWSIPSFTTAERDALAVTSTTYLLIMNTTTGKLNFYSGSGWEVITSA